MKTADAIAYWGTATSLAKALGIDRTALSKWGEDVPKLRRYQIYVLSNFHVPLGEAHHVITADRRHVRTTHTDEDITNKTHTITSLGPVPRHYPGTPTLGAGAQRTTKDRNQRTKS